MTDQGRLPTGSLTTLDRQLLSDPDGSASTEERRYLVEGHLAAKTDMRSFNVLIAFS